MVNRTIHLGKTPLVPLYTGPSDIMGSAYAYWGLWAYTAAYAAGLGNAVDICDNTGANSRTIVFNADGSLNETALVGGGTLADAIAASRAYVSKLYDQSGNGIHLTRPSGSPYSQNYVFVQNALNSKSALYSNSTPNILTASTYGALSQPYTMIGGAKKVSSNDVALDFIYEDDTNFGGGHLRFNFRASNTFGLFAGSAIPTIACAADVFHSLAGLYNGASSIIRVDSTNSGSVSPGTDGILGTGGSPARVLGFGHPNDTQEYYTLYGGIWSGDKSSNFAALNTAITAYWGI